jgi:antitoxin YefM
MKQKKPNLFETSADELRSLRETLHLLRSPKNAHRLLRAMRQAQTKSVPPTSLDDLKREFGIDPIETTSNDD